MFGSLPLIALHVCFKMAAQEEEPVELEEENKALKTKKHDSGAADLEKVTDYVEETEMTAQTISDAMKAVNDRKAKERVLKQEREKELAKVKINKEDVDLIEQEMEIARNVAERTLREHKGNIVEALVALTN